MPDPLHDCAETQPAGDLLARLRAVGTPRPVVDPALAGGLRAWLEDGVPGIAGDGTGPLVLDRLALSEGVLRPHQIGAGRRWPAADLRHAFVGILFRYAVTAGPLPHPFEGALAALAVTRPGPDIVRSVQQLDPRQRADLRRHVEAHAARIAADWRPVPSRWLPRTSERMAVPLAGGRVLISGVADLALGAPSSGRASVCLLDVRSSPPIAHDRRARDLLALAETLRSGAPPFRVATYYAGLGNLVTEDVTEPLLLAAVADVLAVIGPARTARGEVSRAA